MKSSGQLTYHYLLRGGLSVIAMRMILKAGLDSSAWPGLWISLMSLKKPGNRVFCSKIENSYSFFVTLA